MPAGEQMSEGFQSLTEREKQTLRLIVRGHDAKSSARELGLSVHTVNERLREARRKLGVSSSREAARLLLEAESPDPQKLGDMEIGDAPGGRAVTSQQSGQAGSRAPEVGSRTLWLISGAVVMSALFAFLALVALPQSATVPPTSAAPVAGAVVETDAVRAARDWLALHDAGRWSECYALTSKAFRKNNTLQGWTDAAEKVRPPLGAVLSRSLTSAESVPTPPAGAELVKFRTSFEHKPDAVETLALTREDGAWKVVGIYID